MAKKEPLRFHVLTTSHSRRENIIKVLDEEDAWEHVITTYIPAIIDRDWVYPVKNGDRLNRHKNKKIDDLVFKLNRAIGYTLDIPACIKLSQNRKTLAFDLMQLEKRVSRLENRD